MNDNWTIMVYISADDVLANFAIDSLNQLRQAAGDGNIVVAQFDPNDESQQAFRVRFDGTNKEIPLKDVKKEQIGRVNMAAAHTLREFINWASKPITDGPKDRHHCLVLWGHGTELLLDKDPGKVKERYLTPAKLKQALEQTDLVATHDKKLDIVAFDACSMSMIELASALQGCAKFMIASQEEVPDVSFPYGQILKGLKTHGEDVKHICELIPDLYVQSFRDYLVTSGMKEIMLSSLNLDKITNITGPVSTLADLLLRSLAHKDLSQAIVLARQQSRDFVLGVFVDLFDFCEKLLEALGDKPFENEDYKRKLKNACQKIFEAINNRENVIANKTRKNVKGCHGVSIYFPYSVEADESEQTKRLLGDAETGTLNLPLVKGGRDNTVKARNGRIEELETDFKHVPFFNDEGWGAFLQQGWSVVLAQKFPRKLDLHYSAEQVAQNLSKALRGAREEVRKLQKENEHMTKDLERLALRPGA